MRTNVNKLTVGALLAALSVIFLYGAGIIPGIELTLYALASFLPAFMIIEFHGKGGIALYVAVSILGFLLAANKLTIIPYVMFFGIYGILKYYIEKIKQPVAQLTLKGLFFLIVFAVAYFFLREIFFAGIALPDLAAPIIIVGGLIFFYLYDAIYTGIISIYMKKIHPFIK